MGIKRSYGYEGRSLLDFNCESFTVKAGVQCELTPIIEEKSAVSIVPAKRWGRDATTSGRREVKSLVHCGIC